MTQILRLNCVKESLPDPTEYLSRMILEKNSNKLQKALFDGENWYNKEGYKSVPKKPLNVQYWAEDLIYGVRIEGHQIYAWRVITTENVVDGIVYQIGETISSGIVKCNVYDTIDVLGKNYEIGNFEKEGFELQIQHLYIIPDWD